MLLLAMSSQIPYCFVDQHFSFSFFFCNHWIDFNWLVLILQYHNAIINFLQSAFPSISYILIFLLKL